MELTVDHVTVAGRDLDVLSRAFADIGLPATYGGKHSNGATHMSIVGFPDGSYVELISTIESATQSPWWHEPIYGDGGPCAWAVAVDDIEMASERLRARGVSVDGPHTYEREQEDGTLIKWDLAFLGEGNPGATLPFYICDRTPRKLRVESTGDPSPVIGVDTVVLGVSELDATIKQFEAAFSLDSPKRGSLDHLDADVAVFPNAPVALARPRNDSWLADRLDRFGPLPAAYLLRIESGSKSAFDTVPDDLAGREVGWIPLTEPVGQRYLGVVETER